MASDPRSTESSSVESAVAEARFLEAEAIAQELVGKLTALDERTRAYGKAAESLELSNEYLSKVCIEVRDIAQCMQRYAHGLEAIDTKSIIYHIDQTGIDVQKVFGGYLEGITGFQSVLSGTVASIDTGVGDYRRSLAEAKAHIESMDDCIKSSLAHVQAMIESRLAGIEADIRKDTERNALALSDSVRMNLETFREHAENLHGATESSLVRIQTLVESRLSAMQNDLGEISERGVSLFGDNGRIAKIQKLSIVALCISMATLALVIITLARQ